MGLSTSVKYCNHQLLLSFQLAPEYFLHRYKIITARKKESWYFKHHDLYGFSLFELHFCCSLIFFPELFIRSKSRENKTLSVSVIPDSRECKASLGPSVTLQERF